jgi:predicted DNA-binding transcriptional regulator AlpA
MAAKREPRRDVSSSHGNHPLEHIRKRQLAKLLTVSPWTLDRWRATDPSFPQPVWLSDSTPAWRVIDIQDWLARRSKGGLAPAWCKQRGGQQ